MGDVENMLIALIVMLVLFCLNITHNQHTMNRNIISINDKIKMVYHATVQYKKPDNPLKVWKSYKVPLHEDEDDYHSEPDSEIYQ